MFNIFKKVLKRENIKRNMLDKEDEKMGKLVIKDGKLVENTPENNPHSVQPQIQQIPPEVLEQMRMESEYNKQEMERQRMQAQQPADIEEEMLQEDISNEPTEEQLAYEQQMTGRQQYEQEQQEQQQPQDFNITVNMIMIGGLPIRINVPGQYIEKFITDLNLAIDRQLHFNVGTQVIITKNILYYSLE